MFLEHGQCLTSLSNSKWFPLMTVAVPEVVPGENSRCTVIVTDSNGCTETLPQLTETPSPWAISRKDKYTVCLSHSARVEADRVWRAATDGGAASVGFCSFVPLQQSSDHGDDRWRHPERLLTASDVAHLPWDRGDNVGSDNIDGVFFSFWAFHRIKIKVIARGLFSTWEALSFCTTNPPSPQKIQQKHKIGPKNGLH